MGTYLSGKFAAIGGVAGSYHAEYRYQGKVNTVSTLCEALYGDPPAITPEVHDVFTLLKIGKKKEEIFRDCIPAVVQRTDVIRIR